MVRLTISSDVAAVTCFADPATRRGATARTTAARAAHGAMSNGTGPTAARTQRSSPTGMKPMAALSRSMGLSSVVGGGG